MHDDGAGLQQQLLMALVALSHPPPLSFLEALLESASALPQPPPSNELTAMAWALVVLDVPGSRACISAMLDLLLPSVLEDVSLLVLATSTDLAGPTPGSKAERGTRCEAAVRRLRQLRLVLLALQMGEGQLSSNEVELSHLVEEGLSAWQEEEQGNAEADALQQHAMVVGRDPFTTEVRPERWDERGRGGLGPAGPSCDTDRPRACSPSDLDHSSLMADCAPLTLGAGGAGGLGCPGRVLRAECVEARHAAAPPPTTHRLAWPHAPPAAAGGSAPLPPQSGRQHRGQHPAAAASGAEAAAGLLGRAVAEPARVAPGPGQRGKGSAAEG